MNKLSTAPPLTGAGLLRPQTYERYLSLDVLRGLTIALMVVVNNPGSWGSIYAPFKLNQMVIQCEQAKWPSAPDIAPAWAGTAVQLTDSELPAGAVMISAGRAAGEVRGARTCSAGEP